MKELMLADSEIDSVLLGHDQPEKNCSNCIWPRVKTSGKR
jgi:hypothetical protein